MLLVRIVALAYWLLLSVLLLVPNPAAFLGRLPENITQDIGVHFTAFTLLALFLGLCRFRVSPWLIVGGLVVYAVATESLQALVPPRTVQWSDYAENLLGVCLGTILSAGVRRWRNGPRSSMPEDGAGPV